MSTSTEHILHPETAAIVRLVKNATAQGCGDFYAGKRLAMRYFASARGELALDGPNSTEPLLVSLHTISQSGAACWTKQPLDEGTVVHLREFSADGEHNWIEAQVAHCTRGIRGHLTGINFRRPPKPEDLSRLDSEPDAEEMEAETTAEGATKRTHM